MTTEGYIKLAGKVLFDDADALQPKREYAGLTSGGCASVQDTSPVERVGTWAGCELDEPRVFVVKCGNDAFTGKIGKVWFEDGEAIVGERYAAIMTLRGFAVEVV